MGFKRCIFSEIFSIMLGHLHFFFDEGHLHVQINIDYRSIFQSYGLNKGYDLFLQFEQKRMI